MPTPHHSCPQSTFGAANVGNGIMLTSRTSHPGSSRVIASVYVESFCGDGLQAVRFDWRW